MKHTIDVPETVDEIKQLPMGRIFQYKPSDIRCESMGWYHDGYDIGLLVDAILSDTQKEAIKDHFFDAIQKTYQGPAMDVVRLLAQGHQWTDIAPNKDYLSSHVITKDITMLTIMNPSDEYNAQAAVFTTMVKHYFGDSYYQSTHPEV